MTPQFREFAVENMCPKGGCDLDCAHRLMTAFVNVVAERTRAYREANPHFRDTYCFWAAYMDTCEEFGLPLQTLLE